MKAEEIKNIMDYNDINSIVKWHKYFTEEKFEEYFDRYLDGELSQEEYDELLDLHDYLNSRLAHEYIKLVENKK